MLFKNPEFFYYFFVLCVLIMGFGFRWLWRQKKIKAWSQSKNLLIGNVSYNKRFIKNLLSFFVIVFLIFALARLQGQGEKIERPSKGLSILLLVDVSKSMLAEDVKPNRLSFLKRELARFLDLSWGDQVALGFFTRSAILMSSFTLDLSAVRSYLLDLSTDYSSHPGTDFKRVLDLAVDTFDRQKNLEQKILLIASDGEDHFKEKQQEIQQLIQENNIRVFTVSVGTKKGSVIPVRDNKGQVKEYKKDAKGQLVISRLSEESLKNFSKWGKGAYYHLTYDGVAIHKLREDLSELAKNSLETQEEFEKIEYYQWFLVLAFLLAGLELVLSDRLRERN